MAKLEIDTDYIAKLAELLQRTGLTEIEISEGDVRVRVAKKIRTVIDVAAQMPHAAAATSTVLPAASQEPSADLAHPGLVTSPMVGTVYLAADPATPPFVALGQEVTEGATVLIIEAMKVMNQIRAPRSGRVVRVFVQNATPVEYGEPLLIIE
jgi:acetyl-CoA carboxylase biotin carboxyl carrier protein